MRRSSSLPSDTNQRAAEIVRMSTQEEPDRDRPSISAYLAEIGRKGGLKGGKARAKKLSSAKRKNIAQRAARARWKKQK
jgi:hypothetical protein